MTTGNQSEVDYLLIKGRCPESRAGTKQGASEGVPRSGHTEKSQVVARNQGRGWARTLSWMARHRAKANDRGSFQKAGEEDISPQKAELVVGSEGGSPLEDGFEDNRGD